MEFKFSLESTVQTKEHERSIAERELRNIENAQKVVDINCRNY
jgi:hypothetical protein